MWESFWNAWVAPLPDVWTKEWFDGLRDVLSLALAALGARLAAMSIKVGRDNEKVTTRQVELMEGQKTLLLELKNLEAKQADAAVRQEAIASRQRLLGVGCRIVLVGGPQSASLLVSVENCVQDFSIDRWRLTLPSASAGGVYVDDFNAPKREFKALSVSPSEHLATFDSSNRVSVGPYATADVDIGSIRFPERSAMSELRYEMYAEFRYFSGSVTGFGPAIPVDNSGQTA